MNEIRVATKEEAKAFGKLAKVDLKLNSSQLTPLEAERSRFVANEVDLYLYREGTPFLFLKDSEPVSLNITRLSSRKRRDAWGRYSNFNIAYTLLNHRYKGYATALCTFIEQSLASQGYERMKSLIGSWGGYRLHTGLNHMMWGLGPNGCIAVDFPLRKGLFPPGIPRLSRSYGISETLTKDILLTILTDPNGLFARTEDEVLEAFEKHPPVFGKVSSASVPAIAQ